MKIETLKKYWVVVWPNGSVSQYSISLTRRDSISEFMKSWAKDWTWMVKNYGVKCLRVNIHFELITPATTPENEQTT